MSGAPIAIRVAAAAETAIVSDILTEAAAWLDESGRPMWKDDELEPRRIAEEVAAGIFILAWSGADAHRLAVRRAFAGGGVSRALMTWAVDEARKRGRRALRLDCEADRVRLRAVYERFGFRHHSDRGAAVLRVTVRVPVVAVPIVRSASLSSEPQSFGRRSLIVHEDLHSGLSSQCGTRPETMPRTQIRHDLPGLRFVDSGPDSDRLGVVVESDPARARTPRVPPSSKARFEGSHAEILHRVYAVLGASSDTEDFSAHAQYSRAQEQYFVALKHPQAPQSRPGPADSPQRQPDNKEEVAGRIFLGQDLARRRGFSKCPTDEPHQ